MTVEPDYQLRAVAGALLRHDAGGNVPRGTCFAFTHPDVFLTARHCIDDDVGYPAALYDVWTGARMRQVLAARCHPEADLAVLHVAADDEETRPPFSASTDAWPAPGIECGVFGFAWGLADDEAKHPGSELFTGPLRGYSTTDRLDLDSASKSRYRFGGAAVEMCLPEGGGFSGGPMFALDAPTTALWLTAKDLHDQDTDEHHAFGLALDNYADWLTEATGSLALPDA